MSANLTLTTHNLSWILLIINNHPSLAASTRTKYAAAISRAAAAGVNFYDAEALAAYAAGLSGSGRSFLKAGLRLWGEQVGRQAKAGATPDNVAAVQATLYRLEALEQAIQVKPSKGAKHHIWLSQVEVRRLYASCGESCPAMALRDRVVIGLLAGAGLRREELSTLQWSDMVVQPVGSIERTILNVTGKGAKDRAVPVSAELAGLLAEWGRWVPRSGALLLAMDRNGNTRGPLTGQSVLEIVRKLGRRIGKPGLSPHDLRRTYAQLGYEAGVPITQISVSLGHANVATTQRYLQLDVDLNAPVSDFIRFA